MAASSPRSWHLAELALVAALAQPSPGTAVAECVPEGDPQRRVYRLVEAATTDEPRWWLTMRGAEPGRREVALPLANARVERSPDRVAVTAMSPNGGIAVRMEANADAPILDVFVNYELEVNVWRDLSPDVDRMNTNGPLPAPGCRAVTPPR